MKFPSVRPIVPQVEPFVYNWNNKHTLAVLHLRNMCKKQMSSQMQVLLEASN